jgi:hypothetical protein
MQYKVVYEKEHAAVGRGFEWKIGNVFHTKDIENAIERHDI